MSFPRSIAIHEEGPREGFQIEKDSIPTERKLQLIGALAGTGLRDIQVVSFVDPRAVPGMADADEVVRRLPDVANVAFTGLWLNRRGFERALAAPRLKLDGLLAATASEAFLQRNQKRTSAEQLAAERDMMEAYLAHGVPVRNAFIMAAFGCNFEGDVPVARVVELVTSLIEIARERDCGIECVTLGDTMGWANPRSVTRVVSAVRERWPEVSIGLHLHDTRGLAIANAYAGLELGVTKFDAAVGGLGGCPFAGNRAAAGNICTEDLVFMCHEMGIETGVDLDALLDCARLAEEIVGHPLPGSVMKGGSLDRFRRR